LNHQAASNTLNWRGLPRIPAESPNFKVVELDSIKMEDGAKELMSAPEMQP
jgi:hypothetical protein